MIQIENYTDNDGNPIHFRPSQNDIVSLKTAGGIIEMKYCLRKSRGGTTKKISKTEYIDERTGELKLFNPQERRSDDLKSVNRSIAAGRDLIRANCTDPSKCRFITLTYADNMMKPEKLYNDYKNFLRRIPQDLKPLKWISAAEPQERGAWHLHVLFVYDNAAPFLDNQTISKAWKQGFVKIQSVDDIDDIGLYLSAYLTNLEFDGIGTPDLNRIKEIVDSEGKSKRYIKGARLPLYPAGMRIFRHSKNCTYPTIEKMTASKADEIVSGASLVFESTKVIFDTESDFKNIINNRVYTTTRKENRKAKYDSPRTSRKV